jgi:MFS family permease
VLAVAALPVLLRTCEQHGGKALDLLATGVFAAFNSLPEDQFLAWGWRMPFLLSAVVVIVGLVLRLKLRESPVFEAEVAAAPTEPERAPIVQAFRDHRREIFLIAGMRLAINTTFYMATVFALSYGTDQLGIPKGELLAMVMVTAALGFVSKPLYGALSDRIGRRPIYLAGSVVGALAAFPFFAALETESLWLIMLAGIVIINISHDLNDAVESSYFSELFGTKVRYTGAALGHQFGAVLGGFSPLIAGGLSAAHGDSWVPVAIYVTVACVISSICVYKCRETYARRLVETPAPEPARFTREPERELAART